METSQLDTVLKKITIFFLYVFAAAMPFAIALTQISLSLACLSWLARVFITKQAVFKKIGLEWAFLAFIFAEILSLFFSTNFDQSFIYLKRLLLIPIVYLLAQNLNSKKHFKGIVFTFVLSCTLYSGLGVLAFLQDSSTRLRHIQNSMTTGGITMIGGLASLSIAAFLKEKPWRLLGVLFALFNMGALILSATRGSWLGFLFGLLIIIYYANKKLFFAVPFLILSFYFLTPDQYSGRIKSFFDPNYPSTAKRLLWWSVGWKIFQDFPIVGIGDVSTQNIYKQYAPDDVDELIGHFHSNYVHIAVTLGAIGLFAFLFMIVKIHIILFKNLLMNLPERGPPTSWAVASMAIFLAFNINGFFEWNFGDSEIITMVWFAIGTALAIPNFEKRPISK